jgi:hypothetical protein
MRSRNRLQAMPRCLSWGCAWWWVGLVAGCTVYPRADYRSLGLVEVSGIVTLDGQPLVGALVTFESPDRTFCYGTTDGKGRYRLMLNSEKSGVIPGEKRVRIRAAAPRDEADAWDEDDPEAGPGAARPEEAVPECYNRNSQLQVTVTGSDSAFNFDLTSDCSVSGRSGVP